MDDDTNTNQQPGDAGADPSQSADGAAAAAQGGGSKTAENPMGLSERELQRLYQPATAIAPDGVFVDGVGLVPHPDLPAVAGLIAQIEAMVRAAEKSADAELHAVLNDVHVMASDLKAKVARVKDSLQGDAGALLAKLHDAL